ncbi:hypothetical protein LTSEWAN_2419 [Salmonella enterica subsp. enterica serovar Wandsworth str. A4-580]|uniref:Uncharacterized protein n=1 Tax=Salmonella enterica subsp. enterica serovar Wandsworth str. A4-580 TaxID=913086 RepID=G5SBA1_SALET|nr:hypothetical protein LTSEWAN_2419 [Salmonella enterica subsp. enterica serovar Wandsworth str. A4-580]
MFGHIISPVSLLAEKIGFNRVDTLKKSVLIVSCRHPIKISWLNRLVKLTEIVVIYRVNNAQKMV